MEFRTEGHYPIPSNLRKNSRYAHILLDNYSGCHSELTAITQYIYHHMEAGATNPEIAKTLRGIAIVEMHHLELLGNCIRQLGVPPRFLTYRGNRVTWWNAGAVCYGRSLTSMLKDDMQGECEAIKGYTASMRQIQEPQIQELLRRIIQDEELHIEQLQKMLQYI